MQREIEKRLVNEGMMDLGNGIGGNGMIPLPTPGIVKYIEVEEQAC